MIRPLLASTVAGAMMIVAVGTAQDRRDPDVGTAVIQGRVMRADTGQPLRRAQIRASAPGVPRVRFASTDGEGRFTLAAVPAGTWTLTASLAGFVTQTLGQRRPFEVVDPIEIEDGERFAAADFALPRGGAISGRVYDESGDPVAGIRVQAMRSRFERGRRELAPTGAVDQSDDTGAFRLYGLPPGDYYVAASLREPGAGQPGDAMASYAPTYFPGTAGLAQAQRIRIGVGDEQVASFPLLAVPTALVSGIALASSGQPLGNGTIVLMPSDFNDAGRALMGTIRPDGTFSFVNVAPGDYFIEIQAGPGRANTTREVAALPIVVGGSDLTGIAITTGRGAVLTGRVVADPAAALPNLSGVSITAEIMRRAPGVVRTLGGSRVDTTGAFRMEDLVGLYAFRVTGVPDGWMVKTITINGTDVSDRIVEFTGRERAARAELVLTSRVTEVSGRITGSGVSASPNATVIVFPEDTTKWAYPSRYLRSTRVGERGEFAISGLPPDARYRAIAVDYVAAGEDTDPDFLAAISERATPFSLGDGERQTLSLVLVER